MPSRRLKSSNGATGAQPQPPSHQKRKKSQGGKRKNNKDVMAQERRDAEARAFLEQAKPRIAARGQTLAVQQTIIPSAKSMPTNQGQQIMYPTNPTDSDHGTGSSSDEDPPPKKRKKTSRRTNRDTTSDDDDDDQLRLAEENGQREKRRREKARKKAVRDAVADSDEEEGLEVPGAPRMHRGFGVAPMENVHENSLAAGSLSTIEQHSHQNQYPPLASVTGTQAAAASLLHMGENRGVMGSFQQSDNTHPLVTPDSKFIDAKQFPANINMSMTTGDASWTHHSRTFVKDVLFKRVKFWDKTMHSGYCMHPSSVCGMFAAMYTFDPGADPTDWWAKVRKNLVDMVTNRRNNMVKTIRKKYLGEYCAWVHTSCVITCQGMANQTIWWPSCVSHLL